jgi:cytochrome oxidase Cu insertion factor (SCO1/SenC/PrrC family)
MNAAGRFLVFALAAAGGPVEQPMLGEPAPPFRLKDLEGRTLSLADLRGKLVVLHFGASW